MQDTERLIQGRCKVGRENRRSCDWMSFILRASCRELTLSSQRERKHLPNASPCRSFLWGCLFSWWEIPLFWLLVSWEQGRRVFGVEPDYGIFPNEFCERGALWSFDLAIVAEAVYLVGWVGRDSWNNIYRLPTFPLVSRLMDRIASPEDMPKS